MPAGNRTEHGESSAVLLITLAALLIRGVAAWLTIDIPGDGVSRALQAYHWSRSPKLVAPGVWLPGFTYLAGTVSFAIPDPMIAPRLLNVILGSASIPLLHAVARRIAGDGPALAAAALLAVLPLHVGLSASSLTEAGFVFAMLGVLWSALGAAERDAPGSRLRLALLVPFGLYAEMVRYEAWLLLPLVIAYVGWRRRSVRAALGLGAALLCFPLLWSIGNLARHGDAFYGFTAAATDVDLVEPTSPLGAAWTILRRAYAIVGPVALAILLYATFDAGVGVSRRMASPERMLVLAVFAGSAAIVFSHALNVGSKLFGRYLIFAIVLALPFATAWTMEYVSRRRLRAAIALACVLSCGLAYRHLRPTLFVTRQRPLAIIELNEWLGGSAYRDDPIIFTRLGWHCSYAQYYSPALASRMLTVSNYTSDEKIQSFIRSAPPALLITRASDIAFRERVERQLGAPIEARRRIKTIGELEIFDIRQAR